MAPRISVSQITTLNSNDGTFGSTHPDSYWAAPADDALAQAREAFERSWYATRAPIPPSTMKEHT